MQLSGKILGQLNKQQVIVPANSLFALPEKILQFGTGVLLRGLPDYFIDKANKQNIFNGRIVVVKSTDSGVTNAFKEQDGLYTLLERGVENGERSEKAVINASISRVLSANEEWNTILQCAANPVMQVIISNTTEIGITLAASDVLTQKPVSFPGRLLHFLQARHDAFNGSDEAGMVIIPTELIPDNGTQLKNIVLTLAKLKGSTDSFIQWLTHANDFCNSLVDRIVPGKPSAADQAIAEKQLGYADELMIMSETYRLWAIETTSERTKTILSFSNIDEGVVLSPDINKFRELKLRLLNGAHTLSCGLAHLAGFQTVKDAMENAPFARYVSNLMLQEIAPLVVKNDISLKEAHHFASQVMDRFKNPYIEHRWLSITVQYTSKMVMRTVPLLEKHYALTHEVPELMALGFSAYILFMKSVKKTDNTFYGEYNGVNYRIQDDKAEILYTIWQSGSIDSVVVLILSDVRIFGSDLTRYPGFSDTVNLYLTSLTQNGTVKTLQSVAAKK